MRPGVYIVGTPIGNLEDIGTRALATLREANLILAEDTRHTQRLLQRYQIRAPLISCHRFNEASRVPLVVARVKAGAAAALVTNAGMPGISDPGARLAAACRKEGLYLTVIPGPSAVTAAVALSGFGGGGFLCEGFLPRKPGARQRRLREICSQPLPVVFMESPYRWLALLEELNAICPGREIFLAREMTKLHEECVWGTVAGLRDQYAARAGSSPARVIRGELVAVLAPAGASGNADSAGG